MKNMFSVKQVLVKISQNSLFLIKKVLSCDFREIFQNTFCYRKHPETASYTPYFHYHLAETFGAK